MVCSSLDADRIATAGVHPVAVVANTYPRPRLPKGREVVGSPPTVLFQGTMRYPPNVDGACWLATEIAPLIHAEHPEVEVRLVGLTNSAVEDLHRPPEVVVAGQVGDIGSELGRADVVIVPVRFGSGTRLKILEAFAHRIPVVSTRLGAEGLGVSDGQHLLVAESAQAMAEAVTRLLTDLPLRRRLVQAAHDLYLDEFQDEVAFRQVADVVRTVTGR